MTFYSFACNYSTPFTEATVLSPLYILGAFVGNQLIIHVWCIWDLCSGPLVYMSVFTQTIQFDYYSWVIEFESAKYESLFILIKLNIL